MKIPIKPLCEQKWQGIDGTSTIYLQWFHDGVHRIFLNTKISVPSQYWNKRQECISEALPADYGHYSDLNEEVDRQLELAKNLIKLAKGQKVVKIGPYVKRNFRPDLDLDALALADFQLKTSYIPENEVAEEGFFKEWKHYIEVKKKWVQPATITVYNNVVGHLRAFEKFKDAPITFESLNYQFYEEFRDFLTFDYEVPRTIPQLYGLRVNTVGKTIKQLRVFIKDRVKRKLIPPIDLTGFKILEEETDAIYLTFEEIGAIYNLDLSDQPELILYRNWFVLACLTGLRFSDFSGLTPADLQKDMLRKKQVKSDHWVVIPLRKEAKEVFTEQFKAELPAISNADFNKKIKVIARMAGVCQLMKFSHKKGNKNVIETKPKWAWITSHTARRSFCTNEFLKGTPVYLIMKISGHKREKDFYKYIRISPEEAAEQIKKLWMERDDWQAFKPSMNPMTNMQSA
jgi:integrase